MRSTPHHTVSSGNIFADLGVAEPEIALRKADLARELIAAIKNRGITQQEAGEVLGIGQPKVSAIVRGHLKDFSVNRLMELLTLLNYDIHISVAPSRDDTRAIGRIVVHGEGKPNQTASIATTSTAS
jgi:predicted XRE-type DNA-binding protein